MAVLATRLKPPPPADDGPRAELRRLVGEHAAFQTRRALLTAAEDASRAAVSRARQAVAEAEQAVEAARVAAGRHIVAVSSGQAVAAPPSVRDARNRLQDAVDQQAAAETGAEQIRAELASTETGVVLWPHRLKEAAADVLKAAPAIPELIDRVTRLQAEMLNASLQLRYLIRAGVVSTADTPSPERYGQPIPSVARGADAFLDQPPVGWLAIEKTVPGAGPWVDALNALMTDADAPLPG